MATKRILRRKSLRDWEKEIRICLTSRGDNFQWGCLSRTGSLFKISTLSNHKVPHKVINGMVENGRLIIKPNDTHYTYIKK